MSAPVGKRSPQGLTELEERYLVARLSGKKPADAYKAAHPDTKAKDSTLASMGRNIECRPHVRAEFERMRAKAHELAKAKAAEDMGINRAYVMKSLKEVADRCMQAEPVLDARGKHVKVEDRDGNEALAYVFNAKGAVAALVPLGKEIGMFADNRRPGAPHAELSDAELDQRVRELAQQVAEATGQSIAGVLRELGLHAAPAPTDDDEATPATPGGDADLAPGMGPIH